MADGLLSANPCSARVADRNVANACFCSGVNRYAGRAAVDSVRQMYRNIFTNTAVYLRIVCTFCFP